MSANWTGVNVAGALGRGILRLKGLGDIGKIIYEEMFDKSIARID
jgi:hypothetical protein